MYSPSLLVAFACLAGFYSNFPRFGSSDIWSDNRSVCEVGNLNLTKCSHRSIRRNFTHPSDRTTTTRIHCRCSPQDGCPSNWSNPDHVIKRQIYKMRGVSTVIKFMYCNSLQNLSFCQRGQTPLVMWGYRHIGQWTQDEVSLNCRCQGPSPLLLQRKEFRNFNKKYEYYVCGNHMPICQSPSTPCLTYSQERITYHCKCRNATSRKECPLHPDNPEGGPHSLYCV